MNAIGLARLLVFFTLVLNFSALAVKRHSVLLAPHSLSWWVDTSNPDSPTVVADYVFSYPIYRSVWSFPLTYTDQFSHNIVIRKQARFTRSRIWSSNYPARWRVQENQLILEVDPRDEAYIESLSRLNVGTLRGNTLEWNLPTTFFGRTEPDAGFVLGTRHEYDKYTGENLVTYVGLDDVNRQMLRLPLDEGEWTALSWAHTRREALASLSLEARMALFRTPSLQVENPTALTVVCTTRNLQPSKQITVRVHRFASWELSARREWKSEGLVERQDAVEFPRIRLEGGIATLRRSLSLHINEVEVRWNNVQLLANIATPNNSFFEINGDRFAMSCRFTP